MKKVIFKEIKINNFLSVGEDTLKLNFTSGITLITGENRDKGGRNGVGKSTIIESLYWGLFGSTIRELKRDMIVHNKTGKNCCVEVYFDISHQDKIDSYVLSRKVEPNKVELLCNGQDITRSSMPKTDELVKELIGANEEVFQNAVIMTANNTLPFMAQKKVDKRKFVEGVLHLGIFGDMLLQVRADLNDFKKQNEQDSSNFLENQKNLEAYKKQSDKWNENKKNKIKNLKEKIEDNLLNIKSLNEKNSDTEGVEQARVNLTKIISKKESKIEQLEKLSIECSEKTFDFNLKINSLNISIRSNKEEIKKLQQTTKTCPVCKQDIEGIDEIHINQLIQDLDSNVKIDQELLKLTTKELNVQKSNCDTICDAISSLKTDIKKHEKELNSLNLVSQEIKQLENRNTEILSDIEEIEKEPDQFLNLRENAEIKNKELEDKLTETQKRINILESAKFIVSEEGVKTFIIKKLLNVLNSKLNFYLQALEAPCKCEFNETFEETIYNERGIECSYFNFSGGERKRIDLAILFMFQDILRMQAGTSFSLSMYDELFDSALDEKGVDKILNILKSRVETYQESIYIVSHNKAADRSGIDQIILLEKQDGVTKILQ
jgi:DNA repair exonuclease SbcCD ATPase subunit